MQQCTTPTKWTQYTKQNAWERWNSYEMLAFCSTGVFMASSLLTITTTATKLLLTFFLLTLFVCLFVRFFSFPPDCGKSHWIICILFFLSIKFLLLLTQKFNFRWIHILMNNCKAPADGKSNTSTLCALLKHEIPAIFHGRS